MRDKDWPAVAILITKVTDVGNVPDRILQIAIHEAAPADIIESLLNRGGDVMARDLFGNTPLHNACALGDKNVIQSLLAHGANPNVNNNNGESPFNHVVYAGQTDIVRLMLQNGADIQPQNMDFWRPLYLASIYGREETVSVLLQHGANVNAQRPLGGTILGETISRGSSHHGTAAILLAGGADPNAPDRPLYLAVDRGLADIVQLLLDHGADIPTADRGRQVPLLHTACILGHTEVIQALLKGGSDVNGLSENGNTALHHWITLSRFRVNTNPRTPISYSDTLRMLLKHGASLQARNDDGKTALDLADDFQRAIIERHQQEIIICRRRPIGPSVAQLVSRAV